MRLSPALFVLATLTLSHFSSAFAQKGNEVDQIRTQIEALQRQLDAIENQSVPKRNVTQIGSGSRIRLRNPELIVKIYDLGDLFALAPPYAAMRQGDLSRNSESLFPSSPGNTGSFGGLGGGGGYFSLGPAHLQAPRSSEHALNQMSGSSAAVSTSQAELIKTIKTTISPEIWDDQGGPATIAKLGNAFIISADEDTHDQIDALLNLFRKRWGTLRTVSVRAWWQWMDPEEIGPILDSDGEDAGAGNKAFGLISDEAWAKIMKDSRDPDNDRRSGYQATVTCYNGQTVHTVSGDQSLAVRDVRVIATKNENDENAGRIGYQPVVSLIQEGVAFQVTPISNVSGRTVLLDVHSRVLLPGPIKAELQKELQRAGEALAPKTVAEAIDDRRFKVSQLSTTLRVPVNRPMLVGGMTLPSDGDKNGHENNLYLFVKVSVQELRNDQDEEAEKPNGGEAPPEDPAADPVEDADSDSNDPPAKKKSGDSAADTSANSTDADSSDSN